MSWSDVKEACALALALFALAVVLGFCHTGCTNTQRQHARILADYEAELERCREVGKAAGWYAVYEACAKAVDRQLCVDKGLRCRDAEGRDVDAPR